MANQRRPREIQYNAPEALSSSFIEMGGDTISRGLGGLEAAFRSWGDNIYDVPHSGLFGLNDQFLSPSHPFNPKCIFDVSHHQAAVNMGAAKAVGQLGVILKATDGSSYVDDWYDRHYQAAVAAGLLTGSYHFGRNADGVEQADHFLSVHQFGIMALDFELATIVRNGKVVPDPKGDMKVDQIEAFISRVFERTGRYPGIYAQSDYLEKLVGSDLAVRNCWVWLARFRSTPAVPAGWLAKGEDWTLWQYTGDGLGPLHDTINGRALDHEEFNGTEEELMTFWQSNSA